MNQLVIIGNLTKDPELRTTSTGLSVCTFTVAVNRKKTKDSTEQEADFFRVTAWRQLGEICAKFTEKGKKVCVVGRVSLNTWDNEKGHGASLEVLADSVEFLSPRASDAPIPAEPSSPVDAQSGMAVVDTDDLPF